MTWTITATRKAFMVMDALNLKPFGSSRSRIEACIARHTLDETSDEFDREMRAIIPGKPQGENLFFDRDLAESLARSFMRCTSRWGGIQTEVVTWGEPIVPPREPVREGVTLCAPWVDRCAEELCAGRRGPVLPTMDTHPALTDVQRMRARDEARRDWHDSVAPDEPNPWWSLTALWAMGVTINRITDAGCEIVNVQEKP